MDKVIKIASRKTPLALKQTELAINFLKKKIPNTRFEVLGLVTTGDRQKNWSLEREGGKGLFTKELEDALLDGRADLAMHSAKDLPANLPTGLCIAGYTEREDPRDVLVIREGVESPKLIGTDSPRRREQIRRFYPQSRFEPIRGKVETRLKKVADGIVDATILAAAGLKRLGISEFEELRFEYLLVQKMVPAVGQGAIALECCEDVAHQYRTLLNKEVAYALKVERSFLVELGGGCQVAYGGYYNDSVFHVFHQNIGYKDFPFKNVREHDVLEAVQDIIATIIK